MFVHYHLTGILLIVFLFIAIVGGSALLLRFIRQKRE